jgi:hypothetical protein
MADEVVSHAFSHGFDSEHTRRLAAYWAEALDGPSSYSDAFGDETFVVRIHSGNGAHEEMDRRAIVCFDLALADVGLAVEDRLGQAARLLRMGDHHGDGAVPRLWRRPGRAERPALVLGRTRRGVRPWRGLITAPQPSPNRCCLGGAGERRQEGIWSVMARRPHVMRTGYSG